MRVILSLFFNRSKFRLAPLTRVISRTNGHGRRKISLISLPIITLLCSCGGGDVRQIGSRSDPAQRLMTVQEIPDLSNCLGQLGTALKTTSQRQNINLNCATGTYRGLTNEGRDCSLKIDGAAQVFRFQVEQEIVAIKWEIVAHAANGMPLDNLHDASATGQPGIELSRFTGSLIPVTEALTLRIGAGLPALPKMIYQRSENGATKFTVCNFGR